MAVDLGLPGIPLAPKSAHSLTTSSRLISLTLPLLSGFNRLSSDTLFDWRVRVAVTSTHVHACVLERGADSTPSRFFALGFVLVRVSRLELLKVLPSVSWSGLHRSDFDRQSRIDPRPSHDSLNLVVLPIRDA